MKKRGIKAWGISLGFTTFMGIVNYILGKTYESIIGISLWGGEIECKYGFGIKFEKYYPLCAMDDPIQSSVRVMIAPIDFIVTVVLLGFFIYLVFLIVDLVRFIVGKCKKR